MSANFSFTTLSDTKIEQFFDDKENRDCFSQWNLDENCFIIQKFGIAGRSLVSQDDYLQLINSMFQSNQIASQLKFFGILSPDSCTVVEPLDTSVFNMSFFDRLKAVAPNGHIRGCQEELFDRIPAGDELRDAILNSDSQHHNLFTEKDKRQFIYHLFALIAIGGPLCQPDTITRRYLAVTKALYKTVLSVYRSSKTQSLEVSSRVYFVKSVPGVELLRGSKCNSPQSGPSGLYLVVDPLLRQIVAIKLDYKPFW